MDKHNIDSIIDSFNELCDTDFKGVTFKFKNENGDTCTIIITQQNMSIYLEGEYNFDINYSWLDYDFRQKVSISNYINNPGTAIYVNTLDSKIFQQVINYVLPIVRDKQLTYKSFSHLNNTKEVKIDVTQAIENLASSFEYFLNYPNLKPKPPNTPHPSVKRPGPLGTSGGRARSRVPYENRTVKELCEVCKARRIKYAGLKKAELIAALRKK